MGFRYLPHHIRDRICLLTFVGYFCEVLKLMVQVPAVIIFKILLIYSLLLNVLLSL